MILCLCLVNASLETKKERRAKDLLLALYALYPGSVFPGKVIFTRSLFFSLYDAFDDIVVAAGAGVCVSPYELALIHAFLYKEQVAFLFLFFLLRAFITI